MTGLRPRNDNQVELRPINIGWRNFTVNNVRYRNSDLTIVWGDPADGGTRYPGVPRGYSVYINGSRALLTWSSPQAISSADVYFFDDNGGVRFPASWRLQYWNGTAFVDVPNPSGYPVAINQYYRVTFTGVTTTRLRVVLQSGQASVGLLEGKAFS